jgi:hypothetical protein
MAYQGYSGSGFVGNFASVELLEARFPAANHAGRIATLELIAGQVTMFFSNGSLWTAISFLENLSFYSFGGIPNISSIDNRNAIQATFTAAAILNKPIYIPTGDWYYKPVTDAQLLNAHNIPGMYGDGPKSRLVCNTVDGTRSRINMTNTNNLVLQDFGFYSPNSVSQGNEPDCAIRITTSDSLIIRNLTFENMRGTCLLTRGCTNVQISGINMKDCWKDGVHTTGAANNVQISNVFCDNGGDDVIAVVGYLSDGARPKNMTISNIHIKGTKSARGISIVGAENITISTATVDDAYGSGLFIATDSSFGTYGCDNVIASNITIVDSGRSASPTYPSIHVLGTASNPANDLRLSNIQVINSGQRGVMIERANNVILDGVSVYGTASSSGIESANSSNVQILNSRLEETNSYGIYIANNCTGYIRLFNIIGKNINASGTAANDFVHIQSSSTATNIDIDQIVLEEQTYTLERSIECANPGITRFGVLTSVADSNTSGPFVTGIAATSLVVGASPWVYTNSNAFPVVFRSWGGTVSQVRLSYNASDWDVSAKLSGTRIVPPGCSIELTYSSAPSAEARTQSLT